MSFVLRPSQLLLTILCGMVHRRQQQIIDFQSFEVARLQDTLPRAVGWAAQALLPRGGLIDYRHCVVSVAMGTVVRCCVQQRTNHFRLAILLARSSTARCRNGRSNDASRCETRCCCCADSWIGIFFVLRRNEAAVKI